MWTTLLTAVRSYGWYSNIKGITSIFGTRGGVIKIFILLFVLSLGIGYFIYSKYKAVEKENHQQEVVQKIKEEDYKINLKITKEVETNKIIIKQKKEQLNVQIKEFNKEKYNEIENNDDFTIVNF